MTTTTVRLPGSGREVPASLALFKVTSLKQFATWDGHAFRGTLRLGTRIVGEVANDGNGGGSYTRFDSRTDPEGNYRLWQRALADSAEFSEFPDLPKSDDGISAYTEEEVVEWLVEEYETAKVVRRAERKSEVLLRRDGAFILYGCKGGSDGEVTDEDISAAVIAETRTHGEGQLEVRRGDAWVKVSG